MAIAFDSAGSAQISTGSILNLPHTISGANTILVANFNTGATDGSIISPVKFAGNSMTRIIIGNTASGSMGLWYLINPPSGLGTIVGTLSAPPGGGDQVTSASFTGVDQTTPIVGSAVGSFHLASSGSLARTIGANNLWVAGIGFNDTPGTSDVSTGQIRRAYGTSSDSVTNILDSNTAGTIRWTFPGNTDGQMLGAELQAASSIVFDSVGGGTNTGGLGTISWTHTIVSSTNTILLANVENDASGTITGLTFAGQALTKILAGTNADWTSVQELWYLKNPPTGLGTFNGTWSIANNPVEAVSMAYTGVNQTTPIVGSKIFIGTTISNGTLTNTAMGAGNLFMGACWFNTNVGTVTTGKGRGTKSGDTANVIIGADSAGGTLIWASIASRDVLILGAELGTASAGIGTNLIQSTGTAVLGVGSTSTTWGASTTTGNLIVVGVALTNATTLGTVSSITDSQSNSYVKAASGTLSSVSDVLNAELWYAKNITGGAGSVTVNHTVDNTAMFAREYSGFNTLDQVGSASGSSATPNSGTVTTTQATELVVIATGDDKGTTQTWTAAGSYSDMVGTATTLTGLSMEDALVSSTGAQTGTLTLGATANWDSLIATFYNLVVSSGPAGFKTLLGVGK